MADWMNFKKRQKGGYLIFYHRVFKKRTLSRRMKNESEAGRPRTRLFFPDALVGAIR